MHDSRAAAPRTTRDVHRNLGDARVAIPWTIRRRRGERDDLVTFLDHYDGMNAIEPRADVIGGAEPRLKRGHTVRDTLVVNPSDRWGIVSSRGTGAHG